LENYSDDIQNDWFEFNIFILYLHQSLCSHRQVLKSNVHDLMFVTSIVAIHGYNPVEHIFGLSGKDFVRHIFDYIYLRRYVLLGYNPMLKYKVFHNMDESLLDQPYTLATYMLKLGKTENEYKDNLNAFPNTLSFSLFHEFSFFQISGSKMIPYLYILS